MGNVNGAKKKKKKRRIPSKKKMNVGWGWGLGVGVSLFLVPEKMIWGVERKRGHKGGCYFGMLLLNLCTWEQGCLFKGFFSVLLVGKYALVDPTIVPTQPHLP